ncbi:hypothetical protein OH76DRAFT_1398147 [Lentinus brumalis]|uniref:Secreted protein n=1 Tax=Lentinus brumalis TaxID=2498619 RepID=A0A371DQE4_9APHY|nr:hypothetical protein OH76DRAFT_1398147 [Polyporus brumalis]
MALWRSSAMSALLSSLHTLLTTERAAQASFVAEFTVLEQCPRTPGHHTHGHADAPLQLAASALTIIQGTLIVSQ